ncbi:MAG TPA: phage minor head protein [Allosphingosinicella sp.]|nr:phage minor head protein [Allosphingosinicella sp.]
MSGLVDIRPLIGLPPDDTRRAFDARGELRTTVKWHDMWQDEHARAFTVAKLARLDLLDTIRNSLADALNNGSTFEQWKANIIPELQRAGWWGRVEDRDLTGTSAPVFIGPRRLETIFRTNMRVSRAAGQWARIQDRKDVAPFLRYSAVMDDRTRPLHRRWHGTILPVDHEWWNTHFPPCGWNCRCTVVQLGERDLERRGWKVSPRPPQDGPPRRFWRSGSPTPEAVPPGIDPGWGYNPGQASMRAIGDKAVSTLGRYGDHDLAGARAMLRDLVDAPAFLQAMDEEGASFPVMLLNDELRDAVGAQSRVGVLSADTWAKQRRSHPEIGIPEYRRLPDLGADPDLVFQQDDQRLIFTRLEDGRWLKAVVKVTADRGELFVTSLQWARAREIERLQSRYPLIFGQITAALAALIAQDAADEPDDGEDEA